MKHILIAGDQTVDWYHYPRPADVVGDNWQLRPSTQGFCLPGGVLLLRELVTAALASHRVDAHVTAPDAPPILSNVSPREMIHSNALLAQDSGQPKSWLVGQSLGFAGPPQAGDSAPRSTPPKPNSPPDLIVLDDHGNGFRNDPQSWPAELRDWNGQIPLIHKMRRPLDKARCQDQLWMHLAPQLDDPATPYVLLVSADDLRGTASVSISQGLSWERTAKDFLFQIKHAEALAPLRACPCLVVLFGWDGAIVYRRSSDPHTAHSPEPVATLHFDPERIEGGFDAEFQGTMFGTTSAFFASLVSLLAQHEAEALEFPTDPRRPLAEIIDGAVPECLSRARLWRKAGFGAANLPAHHYPIDVVFPQPTDDQSAPLPGPFEFSWTLVPPATSSTQADPAHWRIIHQEWSSINAIVAREYVRTGKAPGLMRSPMGVFGDLKTVDRAEIESYNSIRALVREFLHARFRERPLCIGVFGPPGAGKSFGVEQVIQSVAGKRAKKLTFNVSQFSSERDLVAACHRIRDIVLEGKTPVAFFDEFDSAGLDGAPLGWLRLFLALMQDGKFRDGEELHPLGKCILVFAGGTTSTFGEFERVARARKKRKGPDFVSRLRGYINIRGPNPQPAEPASPPRQDLSANATASPLPDHPLPDPQVDDPEFVLRRALLLRSMLERNKDASGLFNSQSELQIDDGVLRALLLVPVYHYGSRSLEAILEMSQLEGHHRFDQYALPPAEQLGMHASVEAFLALTRSTAPDTPEIDRLRVWLRMIDRDVRRIPPRQAADWGGNGDRPRTPLIEDGHEFETLAEQSHEFWCQTAKSRRVQFGEEEVPRRTSPYLRPFSELPRAIRHLIESRVRQIPVILGSAGLEIVRRGEPDDWEDPRIIEKLAQMVHGTYQETIQGETEARRQAGFLPQFNPNARPFAELPHAKQESNRDFVRTIPRKLFQVGLSLQPRSRTALEPGPESIQLLKERRERLAQVEHTRWTWQSVLQGYVYKPGAKSDARRTNPCIVPWDRLPESIRQYDRLDPKILAGIIFEAGFDVKLTSA